MGDFEMGLSKTGTMCFKGFECPIADVLSSKMFRNTGYYWKAQSEETMEILELYWAEEPSPSSGMTPPLMVMLPREGENSYQRGGKIHTEQPPKKTREGCGVNTTANQS
jgi:hypothetical protein